LIIWWKLIKLQVSALTILLTTVMLTSHIFAVVSSLSVLFLVICWIMTGWPLIWKTWKSQGLPKWSGKSQGNGKSQGKVRGSELRCVFQALNTPKLVFRPGLCPEPRWGSLCHSPDPLVSWGGEHLIPLPQLLQPQLLNNWLSGLILFFINMKQRLLTISVNTRYRVIFACLYWKSQQKVREFHVVWKITVECDLLCVASWNCRQNCRRCHRNLPTLSTQVIWAAEALTSGQVAAIFCPSLLHVDM